MPKFNMTIATSTPGAKAFVEDTLANRKSKGLNATVTRDEPGEMVVQVDHPTISTSVAAAAFASDFTGMSPHLMASAVMCE